MMAVSEEMPTHAVMVCHGHIHICLLEIAKGCLSLSYIRCQLTAVPTSSGIFNLIDIVSCFSSDSLLFGCHRGCCFLWRNCQTKTCLLAIHSLCWYVPSRCVACAVAHQHLVTGWRGCSWSDTTMTGISCLPSFLNRSQELPAAWLEIVSNDLSLDRIYRSIGWFVCLKESLNGSGPGIALPYDMFSLREISHLSHVSPGQPARSL